MRRRNAPGTASERTASERIRGRTRVLLVDDHPIARLGLKTLIEGEPNFFVCAEGDGAPECARMLAGSRPDLAVIELALKKASGLELIRQLKALHPSIRVLVVSGEEEVIYAERAIRAGALGYVMKDMPAESILAAVRRVLSGELHLSEPVKQKILHRLADAPRRDAAFLVDSLSDREIEVFRLIGMGYRTRQIANKLHLSAKTVDSHREHLVRKLSIGNAELLRLAIQWVNGARTR